MSGRGIRILAAAGLAAAMLLVDPTVGAAQHSRTAATDVVAITVGRDHACALLSGGTVKCWGRNTNGQLGNGTTTNSDVPVAVGGLTGVTAISAADKSTCALLRAGTITCWGNNAYGQLGNGTRIGSLVPVAVKGLSGATTISARGTTACVRLNTGRAMCWGEILGNGTGTSSSVPVAVTGLSGVLSVAAGSYENACALLNTGRAKCWGDNAFGEVGHGTTAGATGPCSLGLRTCYPNPVAVVGLTSATAISAGKFHACALISGGTVKCWGDNEAAQLGNGTNSGPDTCAAGFACNPAPGAVTGLTGATAVGAGGFQTCALVGGTVECWGLNHFGELGDGTTTSSGVPVTVVGL